MERPIHIFSPPHREEMGHQDGNRHASHLQELLRRLLVEEEEPERPHRHRDQEIQELPRAQDVLVLAGDDIRGGDKGQARHEEKLQPIRPFRPGHRKQAHTEQGGERHRERRDIALPYAPAQDEPIHRGDTQQRGGERPPAERTEDVHPPPKQGQEPKDVHPEQTAHADNQRRVVRPVGRLRVVVGDEQLVERQDEAEHRDRRGAKRQEVGVRAGQQGIEKQGKQRLLAHQHQRVVRPVHQERPQSHQREAGEVSDGLIPEHEAERVPQGSGRHLAIHRIADGTYVSGYPAYNASARHVHVHAGRRERVPILAMVIEALHLFQWTIEN